MILYIKNEKCDYMNPKVDVVNTSGKEFFLVPDDEKLRIQNFQHIYFLYIFFLSNLEV